MPEIRLAGGENMRNINLGSLEIQEVRLGDILVWRNNLAPVYVTLTWDGNAFTTTRNDDGTDSETMDEFTFTPGSSTFAGQVSGTAGTGANESRNINIVLGTVEDPDNVGAVVADQQYIIGYRLMRPDGSYAAGDPEAAGNNADGAPIADFGASLPGSTAVWDAINGIYTSGDTSRTSVTISAPIRAIDNTGSADVPSTTIVTASTQAFADTGTWQLIIIDSNGGESELGNIDVTLTYQAPNGVIITNAAAAPLAANAVISTSSSSPTEFTNATITGPSAITLGTTDTGGPRVSYSWSCVSGCTGTIPATTGTTFGPINIPQDASGTATPARVRVAITGRVSPTNNPASVTTFTDVYFRSGPSVTAPNWNYDGDTGGTCSAGSAISYTAEAESTNDHLVGYAHTSYSDSPQTITGTCPACDVTDSISGSSSTETLTLSGTSITTPASTPSQTYLGGRSISTRCNVSPGTPWLDKFAIESTFIGCSATRTQLMNNSTEMADYELDPTSGMACAGMVAMRRCGVNTLLFRCNDTAGGADGQTINATMITSTAPTGLQTAPTVTSGTANFACSGSNLQMTMAESTSVWAGGGRHGIHTMSCNPITGTPTCSPSGVNGTRANLQPNAPGTHTLNISDAAMTIAGTWTSCEIECTLSLQGWNSTVTFNAGTVAPCP